MPPLKRRKYAFSGRYLPKEITDMNAALEGVMERKKVTKQGALYLLLTAPLPDVSRDKLEELRLKGEEQAEVAHAKRRRMIELAERDDIPLPATLRRPAEKPAKPPYYDRTLTCKECGHRNRLQPGEYIENCGSCQTSFVMQPQSVRIAYHNR